ncbi:MAG: hypothetical protein WBS54_02680, partial [Acidobacteriota bacterium]
FPKALAVYGAALVLGVTGGLAPLMKGAPERAEAKGQVSSPAGPDAVMSRVSLPAAFSTGMSPAAGSVVGSADFLPEGPETYTAAFPLFGLSPSTFSLWVRCYELNSSQFKPVGMVYPPLQGGEAMVELKGLKRGQPYYAEIEESVVVQTPAGEAPSSLPVPVGGLYVSWPSGSSFGGYMILDATQQMLRIGLLGGREETHWEVRLVSGSESQTLSARGSRDELSVDRSEGRWHGALTVYIWAQNGGSGPLVPVTSMQAGAVSLSGSPEDNADGPDDIREVAKGTAGASTVTLVLDGQPPVSASDLLPTLRGGNPFSYYLVKVKPSGAIQRTRYDFRSSTNSFVLKTCNPYRKPFVWALQVDPSSIPQNLVLMETPQVTGGLPCSAGALGSCKKPARMCYYGDAYTAPSTLALSSSAPSWTVNMAHKWAGPINAYAGGTATGGGETVWLPNLPAGGVMTITANFGGSMLSSFPTTIATTSPWWLAFNPGPLTVTYNGAVGSATPGGPSYTFCGFGIGHSDGYNNGNGGIHWCPPNQLTCSYTFSVYTDSSLGQYPYNFFYINPVFLPTGVPCIYTVDGNSKISSPLSRVAN